jgi:hypothetical protein
MDLTKIKSAVLNQLTNTNGLCSLKIQNHIYGCFIIMEDLAQGGITLSGTVLSTPKYSFDLDKQFSMIGVRYGFAMDTHLVLETFSTEYHNTWIQYFKGIYLAKDIKDVDNIEDCLIEAVQTCVKPDEAFFVAACGGGSLPQEWIEKVLNLIHPLPVITTTDTTEATKVAEKEKDEKEEKDEEVQKTALTHAITEKPLSVRRYLATTRRSNPNTSNPNTIVVSLKKKVLAKTRRQINK